MQCISFDGLHFQPYSSLFISLQLLVVSQDMLFNIPFQRMACDSNFNCSSRGSCEEGVCVCSVQFSGDQCTKTNVGFTAAFSSLFSVLFLVSFVQLILCIQAEHRKLKNGTWWSACRITTQKLLYFLALIAALTRILYFSFMGVIPDQWLNTMEMAYHPLLITGMSLVVCYWSEAFFLEDVSANASRRACFLSKSFLAFSVFNLILYLTVIAQFIVVATGASGLVSVNHWMNGAFQSFFAVVLFVVYIVFMTVGVEIFFKVRGAFNRGDESPSTSSQSVEIINYREVVKSRLAIVSQALFLLLIVLCVVSNAVATLWKDKVQVQTRSIHTIIHRIAEVGVVLWFPCVLWNSKRPESLWFLNPRCLLKLRDNQVVEKLLPGRSTKRSYSTFDIPEEKPGGNSDTESECWICYDQNADSGPLISPCLCKGGMARVHHNCLQRWLIENASDHGAACQVCKHRYAIREESVHVLTCFHHKKRLIMIFPALALCVVAPCLSVYVFRHGENMATAAKVIVLGISIIVELVSLKILGVNFSKLYQMTRQSAMRILNYDPVESSDGSKTGISSMDIQQPSYQVLPAIEVHHYVQRTNVDMASSVATENSFGVSSCEEASSHMPL